MIDRDGLEAQLVEKLAGHYGYYQYIRHGVVVPGVALVAPVWCGDESYGDCDVIAKAVADHLVATGETPHILLANLPWATPGREENQWLQHTMVCQGSMIQGNLHWWGYTPYDQLIAGRVGCLDVNNLTFPLGIREQIPVEEFYDRYAGKIAHGYAYVDEEQRLVIDAEPGPGESVAVVVQQEVAKADLAGPALFDPATGVFVEFAACAGINTRGQNIVGYKYRLFRDSFADGALSTVAFADFFIVTAETLLPRLIEKVRAWEPPKTLARMISPTFDSRLADVRLVEDYDGGSLSKAINTLGEPLYWLVVNSLTAGPSAQAAFDRLKQPKPASL